MKVVWLGVSAIRKRSVCIGVQHNPTLTALPQTVDMELKPPFTLIVGRMSSPERYKGHDLVMDACP